MQEEQRHAFAAVTMKQHAPIVDAIESKKQTGFGTCYDGESSGKKGPGRLPAFSFYSARNPSTGSTRIARSAGGTHAMIAATSSSALAVASASASVVVTP